MAGQINIAGTSGSVQLFGNDTIVTDINIYFPPAGGLLFANGNALEATTGTFSGNITAAGSGVFAGNLFTGNKYTNGTGALIAAPGYMQLRCDDGASDFILCLKDGNAAPDSVFTVDNAGGISAAGNVVSGLSLIHI